MSLPLDVSPSGLTPAIIPAVDRGAVLMAPAIAAAVASARWEMADLVARRGRDLAPDLLRGRAAELALSPLAEDQILSVVLDALASQLEQGQEALGVLSPLDGPSPVDRTVSVTVADQANWLQASAADEAWVSELVARRRSLGLSATGLAARLAEDADLQALLCHDPRIPADADLRRRMAAIVPFIVRRGRELNPSWWRRHFQKLADQGLSDPTSGAAPDRPPIVLCVTDHDRLLRLACAALLGEPRAASPLLREIERAAVVPDHDLPIHAVRLGDRVGYSDRISGKFRKVRLVGRRRTRDAALLSVLTPVGSALIGLSVGETIHWKDHFGLDTIVTVRTVEHDASS